MSEGELKKRTPLLSDIFDSQVKEFHNIIDECAKEFPKVKIEIGSWDDPIDFAAPEKLRIEQLNAIYEWRKKWFGASK